MMGQSFSRRSRVVAAAALLACVAGFGWRPLRVAAATVTSPFRLPGAGGAVPRGTVTLFADTLGDATPQGIAAGPDGALWFTDTGNDVIGRITVHGQYTEFSGGGNELSTGIVAGPDGAMWFTTSLDSPQIGRITTNGTLKYFPDPDGEFPVGITVGPDGALWFAESNGTVGRMTTRGRVSHVTVAASDAELSGITTGPDGALWVTQRTSASHFANTVFRVTTGGVVTSFTVGAGPNTICAGPDGALWFTEEGSGAIGRLTTNGQYKDFPIGGASPVPEGIAAGPGRALWFTVFNGGGEIGRITSSGAMQFYPVAAEVDEIVQGPAGAMWFTAGQDIAAIGRIATR